MSNNKDVLSMLQSRIAKRANLLTNSANYSYVAVSLYVNDQKADKKAMKEIVHLRREVNLLSNALDSVGDQLMRIHLKGLS